MIALRPSEEEIVRDILARLLPAGATARVFGSRARGTPKPYSDLDIAIFADAPLTLARLADFAEAFSESDLPFKVDVVDYVFLPPALRAAVDRDGVAISREP